MRFFKRKLAIVLALLLVLPIIPARAEETGMMTGALAELDIAHEDTAAGTDVAGLEKTVSGNDAAANVPLTEQPKENQPLLMQFFSIREIECGKSA